LVINTKKTPGSFGALMKPTAVINGHSVPLEWGQNVIPAPPGVHNIEISCTWLWRIGKAQIVVDNTAAPAAPVYYAAPWNNFMKGAIGHQPVKNPGLGIMIGVLVAVVLLACACVGIPALLDNSTTGY
jgi:hypothetical protein